MKVRERVVFSMISALIMAGCLLVFSVLLLMENEYYHWDYNMIPLLFVICGLYGFPLYVLARYVRSKKGFLSLVLVLFLVVFLCIAFQVAFEYRSLFGATWLPAEVFWELVVYQGKGFYVLAVGCVLSMIITVIVCSKNDSF